MRCSLTVDYARAAALAGLGQVVRADVMLEMTNRTDVMSGAACGGKLFK